MNELNRCGWMACGVVSFACGAVGAFLPVVPTVPFLLLATCAFSRSSPRMHRWIVRHPRYGPPIRAWQKHGCISRRTKFACVAAMIGTTGFTWLIGVPPWALLGQAIMLSCVLLFVLTRPEQIQNARAAQ